jgi:hypothetical protein
MRLLILVSGIIYTFGAIFKPYMGSCVNYGCMCAGSEVRFFTAVKCADTPLNRCKAKANCERLRNGDCDYAETPSYRRCRALAGGYGDPVPVDPPKQCYIGGCNSEICADEPMMGICIYNPQAACYRSAVCEVQGDGSCGWTKTPELDMCLSSTKSDPPVYVDPISSDPQPVLLAVDSS